MDEVRRPDDGELCGFVTERAGSWKALTVFGAVLGEYADPTDARDCVLVEGLASLSERWNLVEGTTGREEVVCIVEATPSQVTVARDYYALPGVPTLTITTAALAAGEWRLER